MLGSFLLYASLSLARDSAVTPQSRLWESPFAVTLAAYDGLWIKDPGLGEAWSDCIYAVRIRAMLGLVDRVVACANGRTQVEAQWIAEAVFEDDASWAPGTGLVMTTTPVDASCGVSSSIFGSSGLRYAFDQSLSSGGADSSFFMTTDLAAESQTFRSAATLPALGKNKRCDVIVRRAQQESQRDNALLQTAAKACQATLAESGCFVGEGYFIAAGGAGL